MAIDQVIELNNKQRCRHASIGDIPAQFIRGAMKRTHSESDMVRCVNSGECHFSNFELFIEKIKKDLPKFLLVNTRLYCLLVLSKTTSLRLLKREGLFWA